MIKASVIGWPIGHSRSPLIHGYWLKLHHIEGAYEKIAVAPQDLQAFLSGLREGDHVGTNVTLPHKEAAVAFINAPDARVRRIGALNTIWREEGRLHATSTDGQGFVSNTLQCINDFTLAHKNITILGAGGSARAIVDELLRCNVSQLNIFNRTHSRAQAIATHFGLSVNAIEQQHLNQCLVTTDLLINTTSTGMNAEGHIQLDWTKLKSDAVVADIVYTPLMTSFLQAAAHRNHRIVPGLGMLLHQAVIGFEKWFGVTPKVTSELYDLIARDIDPDYRT
jgi:shikimate dehydrogenase